MKKILICLFCCVSLCAIAKEEPAFFAEDFANQSMIYVQDKNKAKRCQAVRISPKWYLTAAHCVRPYCDRDCTIQVQLLNGPLQAAALLHHNQSSPHVFVPASYRPDDPKSIRSDIALVRFDPTEEEYLFIDNIAQQRVDKASFITLLNQSSHATQRSQWQALEAASPRLLSVSNSSSRLVLLPIGVPDLRSGEIYFKQSQPSSFYYFPQLRYYMGPNFGVEQGMSGSGVVLPGKGIIGIVSASVQDQSELVAYNEDDEPVAVMPYSEDYFLFTPLNRQNISFIENTIRNFHESGRGVNVKKLSTSQAPVVEQTVQEVFTGFAPQTLLQQQN